MHSNDDTMPSISIGTRMGLMNNLSSSNNNNRKSNRTSTNLETMRRVIILGDSRVGKTSFIKRIVVRKVAKLTEHLFRMMPLTRNTKKQSNSIL